MRGHMGRSHRLRLYVLGTLEEPAVALSVADELDSIEDMRDRLASIGVRSRIGTRSEIGEARVTIEGEVLPVTWRAA